MKILKTKLHFEWIARGKLLTPMLLVMALWCFSTEAMTQTFSELDNPTKEAIKTSFESEINWITDELHNVNPSQGISLESHRNVLQCYRSSIQLYRDGGDISLRDAFVKSVILLQKSPVEGTPVAQSLFTGDVNTRFLYLSSIPFNLMGQGHSTLAPNTGGLDGENVGKKLAPITASIEQVLDNLVIVGSVISPMENLFEFIRLHK